MLLHFVTLLCVLLALPGKRVVVDLHAFESSRSNAANKTTGIFQTALARQMGAKLTQKPSGETQRMAVDTIGCAIVAGSIATIGPGALFVMFGVSYISNPKNGFIDPPDVNPGPKQNVLERYGKLLRSVAQTSPDYVTSRIEWPHDSSFDTNWMSMKEAAAVEASKTPDEMLEDMRCNLDKIVNLEGKIKETKEKHFKAIGRANLMGEKLQIQEQLNAEVTTLEESSAVLTERLCLSLCESAFESACCKRNCAEQFKKDTADLLAGRKIDTKALLLPGVSKEKKSVLMPTSPLLKAALEIDDD